jgi:hypothetical protein
MEEMQQGGGAMKPPTPWLAAVEAVESAVQAEDLRVSGGALRS